MKPSIVFRRGKGLLQDGKPLKSAVHPKGPKTKRREPRTASLKTMVVEVVPEDVPVVRVPRKVYLKLKARDRRKRERKEADRLGITVMEYLGLKSKEKRDGAGTGKRPAG